MSELARLLARLAGNGTELAATSTLVVFARGNALPGDGRGRSISRSTSGFGGGSGRRTSSHSRRQEARRSSGLPGCASCCCDGPAPLTATAGDLSLSGDPNPTWNGEESARADTSTEKPAASHELVDLVRLVGADEKPAASLVLVDLVRLVGADEKPAASLVLVDLVIGQW